MIKGVTLIFILVASFPLAAQISFKKITLDKELLSEISGLEIEDSHFLAHNDSGFEPVIYRLNKEGQVISTLSLDNITNVDWEDIAVDPDHIYIADIGNNFGNRKDLKVYKINKQTSKVDEIPFVYQNQIEYRKEYYNEYDAEAIILFNKKILLFSKNRLKEITQVYELMTKSEQQQLVPVDSVDIEGLVTGADYSQKSNLLALCGYSQENVKQYVYLYRDFKLPMDVKQMEKITLPEEYDNTQIEAIKVLTSKEILLASESEDGGDPFLLLLTFPENYFTKE
jgi:hypothetical protein